VKILVQWGAGNIGRSFIGQLFARNGYKVVFVDIDMNLVQALNKAGRYEVRHLSFGTEKSLSVEGVSAVDGRDDSAVIEQIVAADYVSFSVGLNVLPRVMPLLAKALERRVCIRPDVPLDIIIAENIHDGAAFIRNLLKIYLPEDFAFEKHVGLVETCIGKMVPIQRGNDPLVVYGEPFNTLIVDKKGFLGPVPSFAGIQAVTPISAYVERKLWLHNMGHAAAAYLGFKRVPERRLLAEVLTDTHVYETVKKAMYQATDVLRKRWPNVFTAEGLISDADDLLHRFQNLALGDTVYRVGRDLKRKLRFDDRLMGLIVTAVENHAEWDAVAEAYAAAFSFTATDSDGLAFAPDSQFLASLSHLSGEEKVKAAAQFSESTISQETISHIVSVIAAKL
jgi:mannitol-1-phosphate 5-dehydrogenase